VRGPIIGETLMSDVEPRSRFEVSSRGNARVRVVVRRLPADEVFSAKVLSAQANRPARARIIIPLLFALCGLLALVVGVGVLVGSSQSGSAEVDEFQAAPRCPAPVDCRQIVPGTVLRTYGTSGRSTSVHVVVRRADGQEVDVRAPKGVPAQIATSGQPVSLTYWHGDVAEVSDPAGHIMWTDDHPAWRAENRGWAVVLFAFVGTLALAAAVAMTVGRRRRNRTRYRLEPL
jgi:hypothetical protein